MDNKETENKVKINGCKSAFRELYEEEPNTVRLSALGFIISISILAIGFWATLLIVVLTGAGFVYGQYRDKKVWIYNLIKKISKLIK